MPLVMVDTNIALRATLPIPGGTARKLWVLFAYGAATCRTQHLALDADELNSAQIHPGGKMHTSSEQITAAEDAVARFEEPNPAYAVNVPQLTSDRDDDPLVFDALRIGADIFVSNDSDVVPDEANGIKQYISFEPLLIRGLTRPSPSDLLHHTRLQLHRTNPVDLAVDVVVADAVDQADVADLCAAFDRNGAFDFQLLDHGDGVAVGQHLAG